MLDRLGETERAARLELAVAEVIKDGRVRTYDMVGTTRRSKGKAIAAAVGDEAGRSGPAVSAARRETFVDEVEAPGRPGWRAGRPTAAEDRLGRGSPRNSGSSTSSWGSFVDPGEGPPDGRTPTVCSPTSPPVKPENVVLPASSSTRGFERGLLAGSRCPHGRLLRQRVPTAARTPAWAPRRRTGGSSPSRRAPSPRQAAQVSVQSAFGCGYEGLDPRTASSRSRDVPRRGPTQPEPRRHGQMRRRPGRGTSSAGSAPSTRAPHGPANFHNTYGLRQLLCRCPRRRPVLRVVGGGLGGCPFTKVAAATPDGGNLVDALHRSGYRTDIEPSEPRGRGPRHGPVLRPATLTGLGLQGRPHLRVRGPAPGEVTPWEPSPESASST